jgi:hypothetical protein
VSMDFCTVRPSAGNRPKPTSVCYTMSWSATPHCSPERTRWKRSGPSLRLSLSPGSRDPARLPKLRGGHLGSGISERTDEMRRALVAAGVDMASPPAATWASQDTDVAAIERQLSHLWAEVTGAESSGWRAHDGVQLGGGSARRRGRTTDFQPTCESVPTSPLAHLSLFRTATTRLRALTPASPCSVMARRRVAVYVTNK